MIITVCTYGAEPAHWNYCEWVFTEPGVKKIRYQTNYDLTILLHNLYVVMGLAAERRRGFLAACKVCKKLKRSKKPRALKDTP